MKQVIFYILLSFCGQVAANEQANKTLDQFHQAAAQANFENYFALFADEGIYMGTDASERWTKDQFKAFVKPYFSRGVGWVYHATERNISPIVNSNLAFFDELLENNNYGQCRGTGVLIKTAKGWKILQYNLSIPIPNDIAGSIVKKIKVFHLAEQP